jgi:WXG100 family type VII secretion target
MASASDTIKFDPDKIAEVATSLRDQRNLFDQYTKAIKQKATSLKSVWQGDTAELYFQKIEQLDKKSVLLTEGFKMFDQDLQSASGIYRGGEASAKEVAETLPTDMFN